MFAQEVCAQVQEAGVMWAAWLIAAIALAAAVFMLRFLIALRREGAPSVCYWVVPVLGRPEKESDLKVRGIYVDEDCRVPEDTRSNYYLEFLEDENYAQEECDSSLIALYVPHVSDRLGWRPVHPSRGFTSCEHRL
jgi:hypothetical protein